MDLSNDKKDEKHRLDEKSLIQDLLSGEVSVTPLMKGVS
jgi:hypothetical protein